MPHPHFSHSNSAEEVGQPRALLTDRVRALLEDCSTESPRIARLTVPVSGRIDPIEWLHAQEASELVYWSDRTPKAVTSTGDSISPCSSPHAEGRRTVGAVGKADVLMSTDQPIDYDRLQREFEPRFECMDTAARYYGGMRFDASQGGATAGAAWHGFGTYRFVLPRFELVEQDGDRALACNLVLPRDADRAETLLTSISALRFPASVDAASLPSPIDRTDRPDEEGWTRMIQWALDAIRGCQIDKVVFARKVGLDLDHTVDPLRVLRHLKAATPRCFHFALRPCEGPAFVGASPERLFRRRGSDVVSEAVAGTRGRGDTAEADAALRKELLTSAKERREHSFVQQAIVEDLKALCTTVDSPDTPSELALARGRHLHARLTGTLDSGVSTFDLLDTLHPTPAVGGVPTEEALTAIRDQEPFDRGWYAGPVGWIGPDAAEFAVAIRSGLVQRSHLSLFSGAGIVEGSVPEREWEEIEQKIGDFAAVLGLQPVHGSPQ